jgi:hypothetical protein
MREKCGLGVRSFVYLLVPLSPLSPQSLAPNPKEKLLNLDKFINYTHLLSVFIAKYEIVPFGE